MSTRELSQSRGIRNTRRQETILVSWEFWWHFYLLQPWTVLFHSRMPPTTRLTLPSATRTFWPSELNRFYLDLSFPVLNAWLPVLEYNLSWHAELTSASLQIAMEMLQKYKRKRFIETRKGCCSHARSCKFLKNWQDKEVSESAGGSSSEIYGLFVWKG